MNLLMVTKRSSCLQQFYSKSSMYKAFLSGLGYRICVVCLFCCCTILQQYFEFGADSAASVSILSVHIHRKSILGYRPNAEFLLVLLQLHTVRQLRYALHDSSVELTTAFEISECHTWLSPKLSSNSSGR